MHLKSPLALALCLSALAVSSMASAADSATLKISGHYTPEPCHITLNGGTGHEIELGGVTDLSDFEAEASFQIKCDALTFLQIHVHDGTNSAEDVFAMTTDAGVTVGQYIVDSFEVEHTSSNENLALQPVGGGMLAFIGEAGGETSIKSVNGTIKILGNIGVSDASRKTSFSGTNTFTLHHL